MKERPLRVSMKYPDILDRFRAIVERTLSDAHLKDCYGLVPHFFYGNETAAALRKIGVRQFDRRLNDEYFDSSSITLAMTTLDGQAVGISTLFALDHEQVQTFCFWSFNNENRSLMRVRAHESLCRDTEGVITVAYTQTDRNLDGRVPLTMFYIKAMRNFMNISPHPVFIECTGQLSLDTKMIKDCQTVTLPEKLCKYVGTTRREARGAEKFARLLGLRPSDFYNLRTLGRVYYTAGNHDASITARNNIHVYS
jgi:hypothetical protein